MKKNTLTVTGTGKISVKPDVAYLEVGVRTLDKDAIEGPGREQGRNE